MTTLSSKQQRPKSVPVTAHRAFPAIVALWFAALLGISSLVVPPEKLSAVVSALGIPHVIPAAAPPLGVTARALLALAMAGAGVVVGLLIGLNIARRAVVHPQRRTDPTRGRQAVPIRSYAYDTTEHLTDSQTDGRSEAEPEPEMAPSQRGPLRASEVFADIEPLTGSPAASDSVRDEVAALDDSHFAVLGAPKLVHDEPGASEEHPAFADIFEEPIHPTDLCFTATGPFATVPEPDAAHGPAPFEAPDAQPVNARALLAVIEPDAHRALVSAPLESLGTVQLVERLAIAMAAAAKQAPVAVAAPAPVVVVQEPVAAAPAAPAAVEEPLELDTVAPIETPESDAPRIEAAVAHAAPAPVEAEPEDTFGREPWAAPDFAKQPPHSIAAPSTTPASAPRPSILEPVALGWADSDESDEDEPTIAPPRFLSARTTAAVETAKAPAFARPVSEPAAGCFLNPLARPAADTDANDGADAGNEDRYPSLLDIQPTPRDPIRIAASAPRPEPAEPARPEPVVVFPGTGLRADAPFAPPPASTLQSRRGMPFQAPLGAQGTPVTPPELPADPVDADEADRALRAALATLQRMSGGR